MQCKLPSNGHQFKSLFLITIISILDVALTDVFRVVRMKLSFPCVTLKLTYFLDVIINHVVKFLSIT